MSKDNTQDELKAAAEQCFIKNNMCDCGEEHTELSIDDTEYFDVGNVVEDIQSLVKAEVCQVLDRLKKESIEYATGDEMAELVYENLIPLPAIEAERKQYE